MADLFQGKYRVPTTRVKWHNYAEGAYFITICTQDRRHWFGEIHNGTMHRTVLGQFAADCIDSIPQHCPYAEIGASIVMPNHIHMIVFINGNKVPHNKRTASVEPFYKTAPRNRDEPFYKTAPRNGDEPFCKMALRNGDGIEPFCKMALQEGQSWLSVVVRQYKSVVTRKARSLGLPFVWQTRFYEHIITNHKSYETITNYIENNVDSWEIDKMHI